MSRFAVREPTGGDGRLNHVRPLIIGLLAAALVVGSGFLPAAAQSDPSTQSAPTVEATIGLGGFVAVGSSTSVSATISTPVLISGRLRVRGEGVSVSRPVEVPAGSRQSYRVAMPPLSDGTRIVVELLDPDDEVIVTESVTVRSTFDEMAVGVVGDESLLRTLGRVRTIITDRPVAPLVVPEEASATVLDVLEYLIVAPAATDRLAEALVWARSGGRLVVDQSVAGSLDIESTPVPMGVAGASVATVGSGRLIVLEGLTGRSTEDWAAILRPTPLDIANSPEWARFGNQGGLLQAATEAGSRQVPSLPWLLFAILGFAVVVGPINFIILSKVGKRDWAWLTIPAVAIIAVAGFWVAGRQRIAGTNLTHASFIIQDGTVEARSAVLIAAGVAGEREVSFDPDVAVYPETIEFGTGAAELRMMGENTARVDLDQLGFTGVGLADDRPDIQLPTASLASETVTVTNDTDQAFWGWGVVRGGAVKVAPSSLEPGASGQIDPPGRQAGGFGFGFVDALVNQRQLWEDRQRADSLWPLTQVLATKTDPSVTYFVGLTDEYRPAVAVDGVSTEVEGTTMVVLRVEGGGGSQQQVGSTTASAQVVGTGFINFVEWANQRIIATDELTVGFTLPRPGLEVGFFDTQAFGAPPNRYEAWSWENGEFLEIERNQPLPPRFVSPDGQVFVRLIGDEFGETPFSPDSLSLEWQT